MTHIFIFISFHKRATVNYKYIFSLIPGVETVETFFFRKNQMTHYYNSKPLSETKKHYVCKKIFHKERGVGEVP